MTPHDQGSLEAEIKAKLHETFPGPGVPIPEGLDEDDIDLPMSARPAVTDKVVFGTTAALVVAILGWGLAAPTSFQARMSAILNWVVTNLGWLFIISATCFVLFAVWLALSRYGRIPLGADDEKFGQRLVAFVVLTPGAAATPDSLKQHVRDNLANYKVPRQITILDELPRSITGKISRKELQDRIDHD